MKSVKKCRQRVWGQLITTMKDTKGERNQPSKLKQHAGPACREVSEVYMLYQRMERYVTARVPTTGKGMRDGSGHTQAGRGRSSAESLNWKCKIFSVCVQSAFFSSLHMRCSPARHVLPENELELQPPTCVCARGSMRSQKEVAACLRLPKVRHAMSIYMRKSLSQHAAHLSNTETMSNSLHMFEEVCPVGECQPSSQVCPVCREADRKLSRKAAPAFLRILLPFDFHVCVQML